MTKQEWTEDDTRILVRTIEETDDPVETACAVAGAVVAVLVHFNEPRLAKALINAMLATLTAPKGEDIP